jgi:uncharacterized protein with HEPN domain
MSNRDQIRFHHMLDAAQAAIAHLSNRTREDLDRNRLLLNGVIRELEILGEAASQITADTRQRHPNLPWREMIGMRNRLIHAYFDIDHQAIWRVVKEHLPSLVDEIKAVLKTSEG